jgi:hypothetical protein
MAGPKSLWATWLEGVAMGNLTARAASINQQANISEHRDLVLTWWEREGLGIRAEMLTGVVNSGG